MDQVEIPHPLLEVGIDQTVEFIGGRLQRLGQELETRREDGHLAGLRIAEPAVDADDVAQIEAIDDLPNLGADLLLAEHDLDPTGAIDEVYEHEAAGASQQHDPPRHADGRPVLRRLVDGFASGPHGGDRHDAVESFAPGIDPQFAKLVELVAAGFFEGGAGALRGSIFLGGGWGRGGRLGCGFGGVWHIGGSVGALGRSRIEPLIVGFW